MGTDTMGMSSVMLVVVALASLLSSCESAPLDAGIECGVASAIFSTNPSALDTALQTKQLSFWWNWNTVTNLASKILSPSSVAAAEKTFVPMVWGAGPFESSTFIQDAAYVMGYNEPDLYGPACCNCDGKQTYSPATSSGWANLFNPASAASLWKETVNKLTSQSKNNVTSGVRRIVSPSMANDAKPKPGVMCTQDPANAANPKRCEGWLSLFKAEALQQSCVGFDGRTTNCWDVIEVIQIHAYALKAEDVFTKIEGYHTEFAEDFSGSNGRTKKLLWLTEVAGGTADGATQTEFATQLMSKTGGLADRSKYPYVERVSWFSEMSFPAFKLGDTVPSVNEAWSSSLFNPFGGLSPVGDAFFANCANTGM